MSPIYNKLKIIVLIPARGGSKGIPKKNVKLFLGEPLINHSIKYAKKCSLIDEIYVSTDNSDIAKLGRDLGAKIINRPKNISTDSATTESAIDHFIKKINANKHIIVLLQPTSPIRPKNALFEALTKFKLNNYDSLLSLSPTHHFFWKISKNNLLHPEYDYMNRPLRQNIDKQNIRFIENGSLYIFNSSNFKTYHNRLGGKIGFVIWDQEYSYELDSNYDWEFLETLNKKNKNNESTP